MIKIERLECPSELTLEMKDTLTQKFKITENDVWNDPSIKPFLKIQLSKMSNDKCAYCECKLGIESKDATIDHIIPKSIDADKVMEWENLILACLRCNRKKNNDTSTIINPTLDNPKSHLYFDSRYRLLGKRNDALGLKTVEVLDINDIERVRTQRFDIGEKTKEKAEEICNEINGRLKKEWRPTQSQLNSLLKLMEEASVKASYSATVATILLHNDIFNTTICTLKDLGYWNDGLQSIFCEINGIKFDMND